MTTYKVTFLIVTGVAIFLMPTIESQKLSLTPQRYPQAPARKDQSSGTPVHPPRFNYLDQELLQAIAQTTQGNFMISPASIKSTLAMLLEAANGRAATELRKALRLPDDHNSARNLFKTFLESLNVKSNGVNLQFANRIFLNSHLNPNPEYKEILKRFYQSDVHSIDFSDQQQSVAYINQWISQATSNKITEFIKGGDFDPSTIMIMANALYFKGTWQQAFEQAATRERCFNTVKGECRTVHMMEIQADFNFGYIDALNADAIELPYKGDKFSMLIILSKEQGDINSVMGDLTHVSIQDVLNQMSESEVQLSLPRFKIEFESELIPMLKTVGISEVFTPNANLSNIVTEGFQNPQVNSVIHKTFIEVNEQGAVAAAVTGAVVIPLMGTTLEIMNINHPFLFFIRDKTSGAVLFGGRVNEPTLVPKGNSKPRGPSGQGERNPGAQTQQNTGNGRNKPTSTQSPAPPQYGNPQGSVVLPANIRPDPSKKTSSSNGLSYSQPANNFQVQQTLPYNTFQYSGGDRSGGSNIGEAQVTTPRYNLRSSVQKTPENSQVNYGQAETQTQGWQFRKIHDAQNQDQVRRAQNEIEKREAEQKRQIEYEQNQQRELSSQRQYELRSKSQGQTQRDPKEPQPRNGPLQQNRPNEPEQNRQQKYNINPEERTYADMVRQSPPKSHSQQLAAPYFRSY